MKEETTKKGTKLVGHSALINFRYKKKLQPSRSRESGEMVGEEEMQITLTPISRYLRTHITR